MKKKIVKVIILALLVGGFTKGKAYYEDRYLGQTYYGKIPEDQDMTYKMQYSDDKKPIGPAISYELDVYNDKEKRRVSFERYRGSDYFKPGDYIEVSASRQISLGEKLVDKKQISEELLRKIN